ncbi:alpha/beta fold hydrolase [Bordetella genomosp. 11]|uniref:Alpha/beta hydrolase n=1 Tax=Bordetella genomosp. 11 TaxID=1416808 RepID=A0A261UHP9_9BORD|nr:alpha/beta fold hydrolase [Bordetella genomosp. 11]OZI60413.1 alpha/beta hydrolase [Bordetella genomosp. 11]
MSTEFVNRIAVEIDGQGDAVVCIHGLGGSSNNWTPVMDAFSRFRTLRIDLPGSARSHAVSGPIGIDSLAQAVRDVCARLGVERAHLVGHSLGTIVCFKLATASPELVRSLALFGPLLCPPDGARPNIRARGQRARDEGVAGMQAIADAIVAGATSADTRQHQPAAVALVRESVMRQDPDGYARSCDALADAQAAPVENIACPTLLVTGDEDGVAPPQSVRAIGERIRDSRVAIYPRCGHWTTFERPDACLRELKDFYSTHAR